jgi:uncharacterized membrane protein
MKNITQAVLVVLLLCGLVTALGCEKPAPHVPDVPESDVTGLWESSVVSVTTPATLVFRAKGKCQVFIGDAWTDGTYRIDGNKIYTTWEYDVDVQIDEHQTYSLQGNKIRLKNKSKVYYLRVASLEQIKDVDYPDVMEYPDVHVPSRWDVRRHPASGL